MDANMRYRPAGAITIVLCLLLVGDLLLCLVGAGSGWLEIDLLTSAAAGEEITEAAALENDLRQSMIGLAQLGVYILCVIFFCMWIYRANCNARAMGSANMSYTPGWSVGWFFVPFMNLFKPFLGMKEIWKASDPYADGESWDQSKSSPIIGAWWALWLLAGLLGQAAFRTSFAAESIDGLLVGSWLQFASDAVGVVLAAVLLMMINGLQSRQNLKHMRILQSDPNDVAGGRQVEERPPWMFTNAA